MNASALQTVAHAGLALWLRGEALAPVPHLCAWAQSQRLLPLLAWRAQQRGGELPAEMAAAAHHARFETAARQALALQQLRALGALAPSLDSPLVLVKGAAIAQTYPQAWQRPYNDIDLLVAPETVPALLTALHGQGYQAIEETLGDRAWHLPGLFPARGGLKLEIHTALAREHGAPMFTLAQWRDTLIPWDAAPGLWLPAPVDHLLYNLHHALIHHGLSIGLLPLADVKFWVQDWDAAMWAQLAERATEYDLSRVTGLALALTAWFWDEPWPAIVHTHFPPPPPELVETAQQVISGGLVQKMPQVWRDLPARSPVGLLRYAGLILLGDPETRRELPFRERVLFFLRRPFRLLKNHGPTLWRLARGDTRTRKIWHTQRHLQEWMLGRE